MKNKEKELKEEILNKLHYNTLKYGEDSQEIDSSYTVIKIWFLWQVFEEFLENNIDLFSKYIIEKKKNNYKTYSKN